MFSKHLQFFGVLKKFTVRVQEREKMQLGMKRRVRSDDHDHDDDDDERRGHAKKAVIINK